tara:strand:- start:7392 stop:7904 length:513 start_codon:yes stop_codon:yes gene_type:complete
MEKTIRNKIAESNLITIDLLEYAQLNNIIEFDIKHFLFESYILKEKKIRQELKNFDFTNYKDKIVALYCSTNAIIPMWAYMLVVSHLNLHCEDVFFGNKNDVIQNIILKNISLINPDDYSNKKVIIKGCGNIPLKESLYISITKKLQNSVKILMFGEACSAVPVYKKLKK